MIIDDLIQSGGTIRETAKVLRAHGAKRVRVFVPHGVFPREEYTTLAEGVDELIVTDSIPSNIERARKVENMIVLSIRPLLEKILP